MDAPKKSLTDKQSAFLEALLGEARGNIRAAMDIAGYSKTTATTEVVGPLREEITERAGMMLAINAPKAAFGIIDVLDDPSALGARNAISAAREVLDRTGLVKKEQVEVSGNAGGIFILPPKTANDDVA
ncbi:hypothetical protein N9C80_02975 [Paracoccaceae bacterium]|jgi:hypothetical protein|nr:hypothetical protein [Paracoccaceae bacterium]